MLLLVHDQETDIAEADAFRQQRMGADDDVDVAGGDLLLDLLGVLRRGEARQLRNPHRQTGEAFGERAVVLARQKRRRHHDSDLTARHCHDEGGAQRNFRLAEPDIAADEAIHRPALGEILDHIGDGAFLILGLGIGEAGTEFVVDPDRRLDRGHLLHRARGRDADELGGHLAHARLHARLAALPAGAAEPVELNARIFRAVARQKLDVLDRKEELAAVILQFEAIVRRTRNIEGLEPDIPPDPVLDMRDEIGRRER